MKEDLVHNIMVRISIFQLPVIMCAVFAVYLVTTNVTQFKQQYDLNLSKYIQLRGRENFHWNNSSEAISGANSHMLKINFFYFWPRFGMQNGSDCRPKQRDRDTQTKRQRQRGIYRETDKKTQKQRQKERQMIQSISDKETVTQAQMEIQRERTRQKKRD